MTEGWCVIKERGWTNLRYTHRFELYATLILRRPMYYCACGKKITPAEYIEYSKYLTARKKAMEAYMRNKP